MSGGRCCYTNNTAVLAEGILIEGYETDGHRLRYILLSLLLPLPMQAPLITMSIFCRFGYELGQRRNNLSRLLWSKLPVILKLRRGILCTAINKSHVAMRVPNKQLETYLHIARSWSAPTIDFQAVICVINRLLNGHCFLEHRCHDIIRKTNSTFLSVDRSPRQLSKAKKSGSSLFIFFFKKACLRIFGRVR